MAHPSLRRLEHIEDRFGAAYAAQKLAALERLARSRLGTAREVERLHEAVLFVRAYPDNRRVLEAARALLAGFATRTDLRRFREMLAHTGIAGTTCWFPFFFPTATWLAARWPGQLQFDRGDVEAGQNLARALPLLVTPLEATALREAQLPGYAAIDRLRRRDETDATFLVRRVLALPGDATTREAVYDAINPSCELLPAVDTPSRTRADYARAPVVFQSADLQRARPDLRASIARPPRNVEVLSAREGRKVIALARGAMVTRKRDLDAFAYGDEREALLVDDGGGLAFVFNGMIPERRAPIAAYFGGLTLQNGVPIGYSQVDCVGRHVALSFNTFETFRGGASAQTFARLLAVLHHVYGSASFSIEPYQLGTTTKKGSRPARGGSTTSLVSVRVIAQRCTWSRPSLRGCNVEPDTGQAAIRWQNFHDGISFSASIRGSQFSCRRWSRSAGAARRRLPTSVAPIASEPLQHCRARRVRAPGWHRCAGSRRMKSGPGRTGRRWSHCYRSNAGGRPSART